MLLLCKNPAVISRKGSKKNIYPLTFIGFSVNKEEFFERRNVLIKNDSRELENEGNF